jgi:hypothetical protein
MNDSNAMNASMAAAQQQNEAAQAAAIEIETNANNGAKTVALTVTAGTRTVPATDRYLTSIGAD